MLLPLLVVLAAAPSDMPLVPSSAQMAEDVQTYFGGETRAAVSVAAVGLVATAVSATLLLHGREGQSPGISPLLRGLSVPLGVLGLAQLTLGTALYLRTGPQVNRLLMQLQSDPATFAREELIRMTRVNGNWPLYRLVEVALIGAGAGVAGYGFVNRIDVAVGLGLGLALQVAVMMVVDAFAERRAHLYGERLAAFGRTP